MNRETRKANLKKLQLPGSSGGAGTRSTRLNRLQKPESPVLSKFFKSTPTKLQATNGKADVLEVERTSCRPELPLQDLPLPDCPLPEALLRCASPEIDESSKPTRPKRTKLNSFLNEDKQNSTTKNAEDFEEAEQPVKRAPRTRAAAASSRTAKNIRNTRSKRQPSIKSAFFRNEQIFSEITAQHCLADNVNPDDMQLALAISKSEAETSGILCDITDVEEVVVDVEEKKNNLNESIRTKLRHYGFRTAPKEDYSSITAAFLPGGLENPRRHKAKWANKFTALTLRDAAAQRRKVNDKAAAFLMRQCVTKPLSDADRRPLPYCCVNRALQNLMAAEQHRIFSRREQLLTTAAMEQFYVQELFAVSTVKPGHLLKDWASIAGRDFTPKKLSLQKQKELRVREQKHAEAYKELEAFFNARSERGDDDLEVAEMTSGTLEQKTEIAGGEIVDHNSFNMTGNASGNEGKKFDGENELDEMIELIERNTDAKETKVEVNKTKEELNQTKADILEENRDLNKQEFSGRETHKFANGGKDIYDQNELDEMVELMVMNTDEKQTRVELNLAEEKLTQTKVELNQQKTDLNKKEVSDIETDKFADDGRKSDDQIELKTKVELIERNTELNKTKAEVNKTKAEANKTKAEFNPPREEVNKTTAEVNKTKPEVNKTKDDLSQQKIELNPQKTDLTQQKVSDVESSQLTNNHIEAKTKHPVVNPQLHIPCSVIESPFKEPPDKKPKLQPENDIFNANENLKDTLKLPNLDQRPRATSPDIFADSEDEMEIGADVAAEEDDKCIVYEIYSSDEVKISSECAESSASEIQLKDQNSIKNTSVLVVDLTEEEEEENEDVGKTLVAIPTKASTTNNIQPLDEDFDIFQSSSPETLSELTPENLQELPLVTLEDSTPEKLKESPSITLQKLPSEILKELSPEILQELPPKDFPKESIIEENSSPTQLSSTSPLLTSTFSISRKLQRSKSNLSFYTSKEKKKANANDESTSQNGADDDDHAFVGMKTVEINTLQEDFRHEQNNTYSFLFKTSMTLEDPYKENESNCESFNETAFNLLKRKYLGSGANSIGKNKRKSVSMTQLQDAAGNNGKASRKRLSFTQLQRKVNKEIEQEEIAAESSGNSPPLKAITNLDLTQPEDNSDCEDCDGDGDDCIILSDDEINYSIWKADKTMQLNGTVDGSPQSSEQDLTNSSDSVGKNSAINFNGKSAEESSSSAHEFSFQELLDERKLSAKKNTSPLDFDDDKEPLQSQVLATQTEGFRTPTKTSDFSKERAEFGILECNSEPITESPFFTPAKVSLTPTKLSLTPYKPNKLLLTPSNSFLTPTKPLSTPTKPIQHEQIEALPSDNSFLSSPSEKSAPMKRYSRTRSSQKFNALLQQVQKDEELNLNTSDIPPLDDYDEFDKLVYGSPKVRKSIPKAAPKRTPIHMDKLLTAELSFRDEPSDKLDYLSPRKLYVSPSKKTPTKQDQPTKPTAQNQELCINGRQYSVRVTTTPKPDFNSQSDAEILKQLYNYGIKPLKRKQALMMLEFIYNQTHPILLNEDDGEEYNVIQKAVGEEEKVQELPSVLEAEKPQPGLQDEEEETLTISEQTAPVAECSEKAEMVSVPSQQKKLNLSDCFGDVLLQHQFYLHAELLDAEECIFQSNVTKKLMLPLVPLHIAWLNLVCSSTVLHEAILTYEPIDLQEIYLFLKSIGYRYDPKDLKLFFDRRCIIFRYDLGGPTKPNRHVRKSKKPIGRQKRR